MQAKDSSCMEEWHEKPLTSVLQLIVSLSILTNYAQAQEHIFIKLSFFVHMVNEFNLSDLLLNVLEAFFVGGDRDCR